MLNKEGKQKLQTIQQLIREMWGEDCRMGEPEILDSPYPEFRIHLWLFDTVDVSIYYDRSALDIAIKQDGKYEILRTFTDKPVTRGMAATQPENLIRNFEILDEVARRLAGR